MEEIFASFAVDQKTANLSSRKLVSHNQAYFTKYNKSANISSREKLQNRKTAKFYGCGYFMFYSRNDDVEHNVDEDFRWESRTDIHNAGILLKESPITHVGDMFGL